MPQGASPNHSGTNGQPYNGIKGILGYIRTPTKILYRYNATVCSVNRPVLVLGHGSQSGPVSALGFNTASDHPTIGTAENNTCQQFSDFQKEMGVKSKEMGVKSI
ncbi:MAG: hypothetical protein IEMM0001_1304 [bacterium]|nr:MAG: hypothetical protein IEMM0001_1304 [bacterium]